MDTDNFLGNDICMVCAKKLALALVGFSIFFNLEYTLAQTQTTKKKKKAATTDSVRDELLSISPKDKEKAVAPEAPKENISATIIPAAYSNNTELPYFLWQADAGRFAITPFGEFTYLTYQGTFITGSPGGVPYKVTGQKYRAGADAEFGIWQKLSVGGGISYMAQYTDEDVSTINGIEDIRFFIKSYYPFSSFKIHYGINFAISPANHVDDNQGNKNTFSGGNTYAPYIGITKKTDSGTFGVEISYAYKDTRITNYDILGNRLAVKGSLTGGNAASGFGFYERKAGTWTLGFAAGYLTESKKTYIYSTSVSPVYQNGESYFIGRFYMPMEYSTMLVVPKLEFQSFLDDQLGTRTLDQKWLAMAGCDVRF